MSGRAVSSGNICNAGAAISRAYNVVAGHCYAVVFRMCSLESKCGITSQDYISRNISITGGTHIGSVTLGYSSNDMQNPAGLMVVMFRATSAYATINGIRAAQSTAASISDCIIDVSN